MPSLRDWGLVVPCCVLSRNSSCRLWSKPRSRSKSRSKASDRSVRPTRTKPGSRATNKRLSVPHGLLSSHHSGSPACAVPSGLVPSFHAYPALTCGAVTCRPFGTGVEWFQVASCPEVLLVAYGQNHDQGQRRRAGAPAPPGGWGSSGWTESSLQLFRVFVSSIPTRSLPPTARCKCAGLQRPHSKFRKEREI
jgi:hypothetical protein